jgi:putative ABC transport system permease protein
VNLARDLRFAIRLLVRNRGFAIAALTVVALGIGATTAVFTVVRAVLLRPLPYANPDTLVAVRVDSSRGVQQTQLNGLEWRAVANRTDLFDGVATYAGVDGNVTGVDDMELLSAASVTENFFDILGVRPIIGRTLNLKQDWSERRISGVMISYELWQRRWRGDRGIVGRHAEFNNIDTTIVGVTPPGLSVQFGPGSPIQRHVDLWFPMAFDDRVPTIPNWPLIARLAPGVTLARAQSELTAVAREVVAAHPGDYKTGTTTMSVVRLQDDVVRDARPALLALTGAVVFVLLVACANLTNLLLTRACARTRELAVRTAVGASRGQIVRQLATESLVLAVLGGALGALFATWGVRALMLFAPRSMPNRESVAVNAGVVFFAMALSLLSALVFGLVPAWQVTRTDLATSLKFDPAARSRVTRGLLVSSQLALSLVLLVGAGLMARTFVSLSRASLGYQPERILTLRSQLAFGNFRGLEGIQAFYLRGIATLDALPGVECASAIGPPMLGDVVVYRRIALDGEQPEIAATTWTVLPDFFQTMGIALREGREFRSDDKTTPERTPIIIDRDLARRLFPDQSAVGRFVLLSPHATSEQPAEIVGVVDHVRMVDVRADGLPQIWVTWLHRPIVNMAFMARAHGDPRAIGNDVQKTVQALRPGRPTHPPETLQAIVDGQRSDTRFAVLVLGAFAILALVLTAVGVYGVVAYATARRTQEIAVRRAIGASAGHIVALVVGEGLGWTALGVVAGVLGARLLARALGSLLYGVSATDPAIFVAMTAGLAAIALAASAIPAIRAARVDPMLALRTD